MAGDGTERGPLERLAHDLGVAEAVELVGWTPISDVPRLLNSATIVLVPSRWEEAFASVAMQAAQMMRPVIATRVGGMGEAVLDNETGLLVAREAPDALADAVCALLRRPAWSAELGARGRARALREFTWDRYLDDYDKLYSLMGKP